MSLTQQEINEMKRQAVALESLYGPYKTLCKRFEEIYFMDNPEKPKGLDVDERDIKTTISPTGRNNVTGLKRILDTGEIQVKVKDRDNTPKADEIEAGLKTIIRVSNEHRIASGEKDSNLSAILYGMNVLTVDGVDDLIAAKTTQPDGSEKTVNQFVKRQLEDLKKRTPFLLGTINPQQAYPEWGEYGLIGHLRKYDMRGNAIMERWGIGEGKVKTDQKYTVYDYFRYDMRLTWADGVDGELFADRWMTAGDVAQLPVFVRYGGGSSLWYEPEREIQPFLYGMAQGEWDKRENLFWTYLFTSIYMQGLPGPTFIRDPQSQDAVKVNYDNGIKIIEGVGKLENVNIIDNDVMQLKRLMDETNSQSTIRPEAFGAGADNSTFSGYVTSMNASKLPSEDPKEGIAKVYRDALLYILKRIKAESIDNELIKPADIPDDIELEVTLEPNLAQDNLRNAQIALNLKNAQLDLSNEWILSNIVNVQDTKKMLREVTKEKFFNAIIQQITQNQEMMQPFLMAAMGQKPQPPKPPEGQPSPNGMPSEPPTSPNGMPPEMEGAAGGMMGEGMPQTDAMVPTGERM